MDGKSYCNLTCAEAQHIQLARPFCADPLVTFHVYPETPNQVPLSEDLSFLPFVSEHLITETFYSEPCPFPYQMPHSSFHKSEYSYGSAFIRKRNERERQRVKCVNEGYAKLRHHLPKEYLEKRLSKVETLRAAIKYIRCQWMSHFLPSPGPAWKRLEESGGTASNMPVLARGEQDGFHYHASEDEEIMGRFWNDKQVKLPCGVALWIPPSLWERIVETIHMPFTSRDKVEEAKSSSEPSPHLLEPRGTKQGEAAAVATSSPSSDSEWNLKPSLTKSTVEDSAVNTGSSCLEKPKLKNSARPEGKYWKRSHHKPHSSDSGPGSYNRKCTEGQLESKAISTGDMSSVAPIQQSAMFETIEQTPRGQLTLKEILRDQDFKPSLREEGSAVSEKQGYRAASDDKCEVTCVGDEEPDITDPVRAHLQQSRERHNQPEFSTCTSDQVQGLKFQTSKSTDRRCGLWASCSKISASLQKLMCAHIHIHTHMDHPLSGQHCDMGVLSEDNTKEAVITKA
ncbi:hypothetical protein DUI87_09740 [Hirundo rustica rustica]|uniref:BHLH domain-containing protein n=1 Tax=Hirundo rustica rustica TaxID=333673 RepID=A0A3M0KG67_HIRRU|nr:hypothetical protein DUI87_09740 [Hirundo rustica rustica]